MLHLVCGPDRLQNSDAIIARICARAKQGVENQILIVPEQFSHETERALCAAGGDTISRYAEVLSFSRLSSRVSSIYGGVCEEYLDKGGRLLTVYRAAQQVMHEIRYFAAALTRAEFLQRLGAAFEEFLSYALPPQALMDATAQLTGQFAQKTLELGLLYESYLSVCAQSRNDPVTRLSRLTKMLLDVPYAENRIFYLDGFSDFTGAELQIISSLLTVSGEVQVALTTDGSKKAVFQTANETVRQLLQLARSLDVQTQTETLGMSTMRSDEVRFWLTELFSGGEAVWEREQIRICLHNADDLDGECAYAAEMIRRLVRDGLRYRDICVAVTDEARYEPALRALFARAGIPAYFAGNEDLCGLPLISFVLAALRAVERYDTQEVLHYLKSGFGPVSLEIADRLEQYAHLWDIRGAAWQQPWRLHPRGFGQKWLEADRETLAQLEAWREIAIAPLASLRDGLREAKTVTEQLRALAMFFTRIDLRETLQMQTQALYDMGEVQRAQQTEQLYDILIAAMEQAHRVLGDVSMEPGQFTQLFSLLLGCYQVGSIPAACDEVHVGPLSAMRHQSAEALIVLGAEEEKLPAFAPQLGILTDDERQKLLSMGLRLAPSQQQRLERELGWVYGAFSAAKSRVALCCASDTPSFLFTKTSALFPQLAVTGEDDVLFLPDASGAAAAVVHAGESGAPWLTDGFLQMAQTLAARSEYAFTPLKAETVHRLYGREVQLSASKIDKFSACRLAYFLRYGLKAEPWKQAKLDAPVFGTFVHYVLECTVRDVMEKGGFAALPEQQVQEIAQRYIDAYAAQYLQDIQNQPERYAYLFSRNLEEVQAVVADVAAELRQSAFLPAAEELSFASGGSLPPVRVDTPEGVSVLSGFVDRVDVFEHGGARYYRVVDYKTGGKEFDYADILLGEGLQMLIYLFALKDGVTQPAGVLYVPAKYPVQRLEPGMDDTQAEAVRAKTLRRKGLVLSDAQVLAAMDEAFADGRYLPVKEKKDGTVTGDVADREQLQKLERFVSRKLAELTGQMLQGQVAPNPVIRGPVQGACQFCDYAQTCHKDACPHENRYIKAVSAEKFWKTLEKQEESHG